MWLAVDVKKDLQVALNIYAPAIGVDNDGYEKAKEKLSILFSKRHKNLLSPYFYYIFDKRSYALFPYCKNGNLIKEIGQFTEEQAWVLIRDISNALSSLHSLHTPKLYQVISPSNIIIDDEGNHLLTDCRSQDVQSQIKKNLKMQPWDTDKCTCLAP